MESVQDWLGARFGATGLACHNTVIGLRLLSEVFATLIMVGLVFGHRIALRSFVAADGAALTGAFAYFARDWSTVPLILPDDHKYEQLRVIYLCVLGAGFAAVLAGSQKG